MYYERVRWGGAASATVGSTEYFGKHKGEYRTYTVEEKATMVLTSSAADTSTSNHALVST